MARRHYSDEEKAKALALLQVNGGNLSGTAKALVIPRKTLSQWAREPERAAPAVVRQDKREEILLALESIIGRALHHLDSDEALSEVKARDLAVILGIVIDKRNVLLGQPTSIVGGAPMFEINLINQDRVGEIPAELLPEYTDRPALPEGEEDDDGGQ